MCALDGTFRFMACAIFAAFVMVGGMGAANAQTPTPAQLLQQYPNGGTPLANAIKQLVRNDNSTFSQFISLVGTANDQQKAILGAALTQLAKEEVLIDQELAIQWQAQIAAINDPIFKTAALDALGDVQLGAIGVGAAGVGLGGPGGGPGGGGLEQIQSTPVGTFPYQITGSTTGLGANITTITTFNSTTTTNESVSPFR